MTTLVKEHPDKSLTSFEPVSTAFVTYPADARRACRWLAAHPNNPLSCLVTKAPMYSDLDWMRVMKSSFRAEVRRVCSQGPRCSGSYLVDQRLDCKSWRLVRIRIERLLSIGLRLLRGFLAMRRMCMNQASHSSSLGAWDRRRHNSSVSSLCQTESEVVGRALAPVARGWSIYCHIIMIWVLTFLMHQCGGLWCCCYLSFHLDDPLASGLCSSKQQRA